MNMFRMLPAAWKLIVWLSALIIVKVRFGHIVAELSHASPPVWLTELVNASLSDGLSWLDCFEMIGVLIAAMLWALAQFAWFHTGEAVYGIWLSHDIRLIWEMRPWCKSKDQRPAVQPSRSKASGKKHRRRKRNKKVRR